ncbi:MAG: hypothetical protein FWC82_00065 [Firmicutes bacterium]|nr:hypothetical protein [Bacillota bacterium]
MKDKLKLKKQESEDAAFREEKVREVRMDFERRASLRRGLEAQWQLNANFVMGNQYCTISQNGSLEEMERDFFWQEREVYNHIAPIFETRLAKLGRVRPKMSIRPASPDEDDVRTGKIASKILASTASNLELDTMIAKATQWSELTGTAFYKVTWDASKGRVLGNLGGKKVHEGEVRVDVCPAYELYPSSLSAESLDELESLIHAKAMPLNEIRRVYGVDVGEEAIELHGQQAVSLIGGFGVESAAFGVRAAKVEGHCLVIERYTRPSPDCPTGEFIAIAGDKLLFCGEMPYLNGIHGERDFPFIKQDALRRTGGFFGVSVIERVIPIQRAYNAVKNRKHEFLNRISMGVLAVEDGSVDTENLEMEGLSPGKILSYRQGSAIPRLLETGRVPPDFAQEEDRLLYEFVSISGVSELVRSSQTRFNNMSGVAIQLLLEQDDTRLSVSAGFVRNAIRQMGKHILRLYKQFAGPGRLSRVVGDTGEVELVYWSKSDITADDIVFDTESEVSATPAVKQGLMFDLLQMGLLHDENGKLSDAMRFRILDTLGYGGMQFSRDIENLNVSRAGKENLAIVNEEPQVGELDRHDLHIAEHTRFALTPDFERLSVKKPEIKERLLAHIREHRQFDKLETQAEMQVEAGVI